MKDREKNNSPLYFLDICYFSCSSFIPESPTFPLYHFLFLLYLKMSLLCLHFWRTFFTEYTIMIWQFFSSLHQSFCSTTFCNPWLLMGNLVIQILWAVLSFVQSEATRPSWCCWSISFIKLGIFRQYFFKYFFLPVSLPFFSGTSVKWASHLILPHRSLKLSLFLKVFFISVVQIGPLLLIYFEVDWFFSLSSPLCYWSHLVNFYLNYCIFLNFIFCSF